MGKSSGGKLLKYLTELLNKKRSLSRALRPIGRR